MNIILPSTHLRRSLAAAALLALASAAAFAQAPAPATTGTTTTAPGAATTTPADKPKQLSAGDKKFVKDVSKSIYFELQLADSVKTGATSDSTKRFGDQVNKELNKAWEALGVIAKDKGETMTSELTGGDKGSAERLKKTKGEQFDKTFFREFLKEAKGLERDFTTASKSANDADIKLFASNYLAIVKGHVTDGEKAEKEAGKKP